MHQGDDAVRRFRRGASKILVGRRRVRASQRDCCAESPRCPGQPASAALYGPPTVIVDAFGPVGTLTFTIPAATVGQGFVVQGFLFDGTGCVAFTDPMAVTAAAY